MLTRSIRWFATPLLTAGYQGTLRIQISGLADQLLSPMAGSMCAVMHSGLVGDSLNYGVSLILGRPRDTEGGSPGNGCNVPSPSAPRGRLAAGVVRVTRRSAAQAEDSRMARTLAATVATSWCRRRYHSRESSAAGVNNVKVAECGRTFRGPDQLLLTLGFNFVRLPLVATVSTPGGTTVRSDTSAGADVLPVANAIGFDAGQNITIEAAARTWRQRQSLPSISAGVEFWGRSELPALPSRSSAPLKNPRNTAEAQVSGSGIAFHKRIG